MNQQIILENLCKNGKLIGSIFNSRMLLQPISSFTDIEQESLNRLIDETKMIRKDSEGNIWLHSSLESALEEMLDIDENINLGKISNYLDYIEKSLSFYLTSKKESHIISIIKNFNNIILALEDNSRLVSRKKSIGFGGAFSLKEKMEYLNFLHKDIIKLKNQAKEIYTFISKYKRNFRSFNSQPLLRKLSEVDVTMGLVSSSLGEELDDIIRMLKTIQREDREQKSFTKKLKAIEYLYEHQRLESETNIIDIVKDIKENKKIRVIKQLNSRYIDTEEYSDRILKFSKKLKTIKKSETKNRSSSIPSERKAKTIEKRYIDFNEVYTLFVKSRDISLLHFIERVDNIKIDSDEVIDIYLEIVDTYHGELQISNHEQFEMTEDKRFSVLKIY
ncbi:MAG: hypothetical protein KAU90_11275, partial [Sulfurovaceae bacterium]|nr:hypothetical protein [Sulfurovaceae bacterium]